MDEDESDRDEEEDGDEGEIDWLVTKKNGKKGFNKGYLGRREGGLLWPLRAALLLPAKNGDVRIFQKI